MQTSSSPSTACPANFRDWPACMRRRYREHALGDHTNSKKGWDDWMVSGRAVQCCRSSYPAAAGWGNRPG